MKLFFSVKRKLIRGALMLLVVSGQVNAAIISSTNTNTEFSSGLYADLQGLEWLSLDENQNTSRDSIENGYGGYVADGWSYASRLQTEKLVNSLWDGIYSGWSQGNAAGANWFLQHFGALRSAISNVGGYPGQGQDSNFLFGSVGECGASASIGCFGGVGIKENLAGDVEAYNVNTGIIEVSYLANSGNIGNFQEEYGGDFGFSNFNAWEFNNEESANPRNGSLLVRKDPFPIPTPPVLLLFGTGILGLVFARRKQKQGSFLVTS